MLPGDTLASCLSLYTLYWTPESSAQLFKDDLMAFLSLYLKVEGDRKHWEVPDDDKMQQGSLAELKFDDSLVPAHCVITEILQVNCMSQCARLV